MPKRRRHPDPLIDALAHGIASFIYSLGNNIADDAVEQVDIALNVANTLNVPDTQRLKRRKFEFTEEDQSEMV